jgi:hypothetical protein
MVEFIIEKDESKNKAKKKVRIPKFVAWMLIGVCVILWLWSAYMVGVMTTCHNSNAKIVYNGGFSYSCFDENAYQKCAFIDCEGKPQVTWQDINP